MFWLCLIFEADGMRHPLKASRFGQEKADGLCSERVTGFIDYNILLEYLCLS